MQNRFQLLCITLLTAFSLTACVATSSQQESSQQAPAATEKTTQSKVFARFVPEREDDFTWENDKVAFRVYGPASPAKGPISGVDAWFKSVDYPIIDKWYREHLSGQSYHEDNGEGYDVYHTGTSRGVGGTAVWIDGEPYPAAAFTGWEVLQNDGQTVRFELSYEWQTPMGLVAEDKRVSLTVGDRLYDVESRFTLNGKPAQLPIAIGLATHDNKAVAEGDQPEGWIATWESIDGKGVGTGALTKGDSVTEIKMTISEVKDESHIWLITNTDSAGILNYSAGFAWEGAGEITNKAQWLDYLRAQAKP